MVPRYFQKFGSLRDSSIHDSNQLRIEVFRNKLSKERANMGRGFRRFQNHSIASCDSTSLVKGGVPKFRTERASKQLRSLTSGLMQSHIG